MKIDYKETTSDLLTRIDIHNKFGSKDIDVWMLETLKLQKGEQDPGYWLRRRQAMLFFL